MDALISAVDLFEKETLPKIDSATIRAHAERFDGQVFKARMYDAISTANVSSGKNIDLSGIAHWQSKPIVAVQPSARALER